MKYLKNENGENIGGNGMKVMAKKRNGVSKLARRNSNNSVIEEEAKKINEINLSISVVSGNNRRNNGNSIRKSNRKEKKKKKKEMAIIKAKEEAMRRNRKRREAGEAYVEIKYQQKMKAKASK